jgi:hypothetical protein
MESNTSLTSASHIVINLNENGTSTVCCTVNGEKIEFTLTEDEEVELLRKVTVILLTKLPPDSSYELLLITI